MSYCSFVNYESLKLEKGTNINVGYTCLYSACFYFLVFVFSSFYPRNNTRRTRVGVAQRLHGKDDVSHEEHILDNEESISERESEPLLNI